MSPEQDTDEAGYGVPVVTQAAAAEAEDLRARAMARALETLAAVVPARAAVLGGIDRRLDAFAASPVVARVEPPLRVADVERWRGDYMRGSCRDDPVAPRRWADRNVAVVATEPSARPRRGRGWPPHPPTSQAVVYVRDRGRLLAIAVLSRLAGDAPIAAVELERLRRVQPLLEIALTLAGANRANGAGAPAGADLRARGLTAREAEVARLAALGGTNAEIASELCVSLSTVKAHMRQVLAKLGLRTRAELAAALVGER